MLYNIHEDKLDYNV